MLSERFELRFSVDLLQKIDGWRRQQSDLPARAEAIRRLIERGLGAGQLDKIPSRSSEPAAEIQSAPLSARKPRTPR